MWVKDTFQQREHVRGKTNFTLKQNCSTYLERKNGVKRGVRLVRETWSTVPKIIKVEERKKKTPKRTKNEEEEKVVQFGGGKVK